MLCNLPKAQSGLLHLLHTAYSSGNTMYSCISAEAGLLQIPQQTASSLNEPLTHTVV